MVKLASLIYVAVVLIYKFVFTINHRNVTKKMNIIGLRIDTPKALFDVSKNGTSSVFPGERMIRFFGDNIVTAGSQLLLVKDNNSCTNIKSNLTSLGSGMYQANSFSVKTLFKKEDIDSAIYFCTQQHGEKPHHLGDHVSIRIAKPTNTLMFSLPAMIVVMALLLLCSGILSGLNLGLMTIDLQELAIIQKAGTEKEKRYAARIYPLRKNGNQLLCTLLLSNVIVNTAFTLFMDNIVKFYDSSPNTTVVVTIVTSFLIVIFGEILPQSFCTRYGLAVGANIVCYVLTTFFMVITSPITYPLSLLLNKMLGEEMGKVYNKERLLELIKQQEQTTKGDGIGNEPEVMIVRGALSLKKKTAGEIMTRFDDIYMISKEDVLDGHKLFEILGKGFTRIPVYDRTKDNIFGIINMRDLVLYDPDDKATAESVCKHYSHQLKFVEPSTTLYQLLEDFRKGETHLAFVKEKNMPEGSRKSTTMDSIPKVPSDQLDTITSKKITGVVTLEDVMEEIIGQEINDEKDAVADNQTRTRRQTVYTGFEGVYKPDISTTVSPQLSLAAYQHLVANCPPFANDLIVEDILKKLLTDRIMQKKPPLTGSYEHLYEKGKDNDCFCLILEGRVEISVGAENLNLEGGPFMKFGEKAIENAAAIAPKKSVSATKGQDVSIFKSCAWKPDFTVTIKQDVIYFWLSSSQYLDAYHASQLAKNQSRQKAPPGNVKPRAHSPSRKKLRSSKNQNKVHSTKPVHPLKSGVKSTPAAATKATCSTIAKDPEKSPMLSRTKSSVSRYRHRFASHSPSRVEVSPKTGDISLNPKSPNTSSKSPNPKVDLAKAPKNLIGEQNSLKHSEIKSKTTPSTTAKTNPLVKSTEKSTNEFLKVKFTSDDQKDMTRSKGTEDTKPPLSSKNKDSVEKSRIGVSLHSGSHPIENKEIKDLYV